MTTLSARTAMLLLAFGLFVSCSTTQKTVRTDHPIQDAIEKKDYQSALKLTDKAIHNNPDDAGLYLTKAQILSKMAESVKKPDQRQPLYKNMRQNLMKAQQLNRQGNGPLESKIKDVLADSWSLEHNQGVSILSKDSADTRTDLNNAMEHLQNATIIMPDSAISHAALSTVYYKLGEIPKALQSMKMAVSDNDSTNADYLERLAYLYSVNKQDSEAVTIYRMLVEQNPENINLLNGLMNVYLDEHAYESIDDIAQTMLEKEPDNALYHQVYARALYKECMSKLAGIRNGFETIQGKNQEESAISDSLNSIEGDARTVMDSAVSHYTRAIRLDSTDSNATYSLGIIYQNTGLAYLQIAQNINKPKLSSFYKAHAQDLLTKGLPYLENYAKRKSSDRKSWQDLRDIYKYLGMNDKAKQASEHLSN